MMTGFSFLGEYPFKTSIACCHGYSEDPDLRCHQGLWTRSPQSHHYMCPCVKEIPHLGCCVCVCVCVCAAE